MPSSLQSTHPRRAGVTCRQRARISRLPSWTYRGSFPLSTGSEHMNCLASSIGETPHRRTVDTMGFSGVRRSRAILVYKRA
jgi:hypothetical protein